MNSIVVRLSRWMSISSSVTAACTETSSAETGSSATTTFGVAGEGAGDADALLLPARELARPAVGEGARQLHQVEQLEASRSRTASASLSPTPNFSSTRDDLAADAVARVQGVERVLEHHLDRGDGARRRACSIGVRRDLDVAEA